MIIKLGNYSYSPNIEVQIENLKTVIVNSGAASSIVAVVHLGDARQNGAAQSSQRTAVVR
jgi:hypothetical protein